MTGLMRSQGSERSSLRVVEWDGAYELIRVSPLAGWDRRRVWDYVREHDVPYNELHERGYPTVGCTHCTRPVPGSTPGDYSRSGPLGGHREDRVRTARPHRTIPRQKGLTSPMTGKPESKVEVAKRRGRHLRGTIAETLGSDAHALRRRRRRAAQVPRHLPAGRPRRAAGAGGGGLGEGVQLHGPGGDPGRRRHRRAVSRARAASPTSTATAPCASPPGRASSSTACSRATSRPRSPASTATLLTTIAACGDVQRNVMGCSAPLADADHAAIRARGRGAGASSCARRTRAYHEIWLDGEKQVSTERRSRSTATVPAAEVQDRGRALDRQLRGHLGPGRGPARRSCGTGRLQRIQPARRRRPRHDPQQGRHHRAAGRAARLRADRARRRGRAHRGRDLPRPRQPERPAARPAQVPARRVGHAALPRGVPAARVVHARRRP